jgi:hypothetical protein
MCGAALCTCHVTQPPSHRKIRVHVRAVHMDHVRQSAPVSNSSHLCSKALGASKGQQCDAWLPGILDFIPQAYATTHFPVFLYLSSHILRNCGTPDSPHQERVAAATLPMIHHACSRLTSLAECNDRPNDTDDLFLTAFKGLLHTPHIFLHQQLLPALVATALPALLVQQPDAFKSVQSFLWRLFDPMTLERAPHPAETQAVLQVCCRVGTHHCECSAASGLLPARTGGAALWHLCMSSARFHSYAISRPMISMMPVLLSQCSYLVFEP